MKAYQLYVKVHSRWLWVRTIHAPGHAEALRKASASLEAEYYDKPIRIEQDESATADLEGKGDA